MTPRCRQRGCDGRVAVTGTTCGRCIRERVEAGRTAADLARVDQLHRGVDQVRAALAAARANR